VNPIIENDMKQIVEYSRENLEALDGVNIFLAGSTGFVGSWLLGAFMASNKYLGTKIRVTAMHRGNPTRIDLSGLSDEYVKWNTSGYTTGVILEPSEQFNVLIDAVAYRDPAPYFALAGRAIGFANMIHMALATNVSRLMYISSGAVVSDRGNYTPEQAAYVYGKMTGEFMYSRLSRSINSVIIPRLYTFMGPGLGSQYAISSFMDQARSGKDIEVDSPLAVRSYLYPVDMVDHLLAILANGKGWTPYVVGSINKMSLIVAANKIGLKYGVMAQHTGSIQVVNDVYLPVLHQQDVELGLEQTVSFEEGIDRWKEYLTISSST